MTMIICDLLLCNNIPGKTSPLMIYPNSLDEFNMPEIIKLETNQRRCLGFLPTKDDITGGGHLVFADLCGDTINIEINVSKKTKNMLAL